MQDPFLTTVFSPKYLPLSWVLWIFIYYLFKVLPQANSSDFVKVCSDYLLFSMTAGSWDVALFSFVYSWRYFRVGSWEWRKYSSLLSCDPLHWWKDFQSFAEGWEEALFSEKRASHALSTSQVEKTQPLLWLPEGQKDRHTHASQCQSSPWVLSDVHGPSSPQELQLSNLSPGCIWASSGFRVVRGREAQPSVLHLPSSPSSQLAQKRFSVGVISNKREEKVGLVEPSSSRHALCHV